MDESYDKGTTTYLQSFSTGDDFRPDKIILNLDGDFSIVLFKNNS